MFMKIPLREGEGLKLLFSVVMCSCSPRERLERT